MATPQLEASRLSSRRRRVVSNRKIPDSPEASGLDPSRAVSRSPKTKKPDRSLRIFRAYLANPNQRHCWSGKILRSELHSPTAARYKIKHLLLGTARVPLRASSQPPFRPSTIYS